MKLTVLMDNNTYIDKYCLGEPAVSYFIEDGDRKILFDTGYSDAFMKNARDMGIDLRQTTDIVISHGHNDHTGGLKALSELDFYKRPVLTAHPDIFLKRYDKKLNIGSPLTEEEVGRFADLRLTRDCYEITENIMFLGEIPEKFERRYAIGTINRACGETDDYIYDDSALACVNDEGVYVVTGCSHSGICNIIERAMETTGKDKLLGVIGGMHLFDADERAERTVKYLEEKAPGDLYPCHCTSFKVKALMDRKLNVSETGAGLVLEW